MGIRRLTVREFKARFPDADTCLDHLFKSMTAAQNLTKCPECKNDFNYKRVKGRKAYQCNDCSNQIYPTAGTIFHKTTTSLEDWFEAIYMFSITKNGVAAKELERTFDVCYKTALRMAHQIKKLMSDRTTQALSGIVSADEAYLGMLAKNRHAKDALNVFNRNAKIGVVGMMEKNGRVRTELMREHWKKGKSVADIVKENVDSSATLVTDGASAYNNMEKTFTQHVIINHQKGEYVKNGFSTNNMENYWSTLKRMIKGTHIHVSRKHFSKYADENSFRYMNRNRQDQMFDLILQRAF